MAVDAERRGFEPRIRFWRIHTFQACSLNHSDISPDELFNLGRKDNHIFTTLNIFLFFYSQFLYFDVKIILNRRFKYVYTINRHFQLGLFAPHCFDRLSMNAPFLRKIAMLSSLKMACLTQKILPWIISINYIHVLTTRFMKFETKNLRTFASRWF